MIFRGMMLYAAILTVNDDEFWKGVNPVELGDMPASREEITVTGYPCGADYVSVIKSRVSRVGMTCYVISQANLLAFEVVTRNAVIFSFLVRLRVLVDALYYIRLMLEIRLQNRIIYVGNNF